MRLPVPEVPAAHHITALFAMPAADRRGYFDGTLCVNCGETIRRVRHPRPGRTDLLGDWEHLQAGIRDPRLCSSVPAAVTA